MGGAKCLTCSVALEPSLRQVVDPVTKESFEIQSCHLCGLGHTLPQPSDLGPYYDPAYHGNRHGLTHRYCIQRRVRFVRRAAPGAANGRRLLDIGCGDGSFLEATRALGWTVFGTELNPTLARQRGLPVEESLAAAGIHGPFDVITSWHSLEYFPNPLRTVREVHALLRPDGRFLAAVPNAEGAHARSFGAKWLHLDVPRHLFHFGPRSLVALLEAARLRPCKFWHQEFEYHFSRVRPECPESYCANAERFIQYLDRKTHRGAGGGAGLKCVPWCLARGGSRARYPRSHLGRCRRHADRCRRSGVRGCLTGYCGHSHPTPRAEHPGRGVPQCRRCGSRHRSSRTYVRSTGDQPRALAGSSS